MGRGAHDFPVAGRKEGESPDAPLSGPVSMFFELGLGREGAGLGRVAGDWWSQTSQSPGFPSLPYPSLASRRRGHRVGATLNLRIVPAAQPG